jgi:hypothetical protein
MKNAGEERSDEPAIFMPEQKGVVIKFFREIKKQHFINNILT